MANLNSQRITPTGTGLTYAAATAGGDRVPAGDDVFLHVRNGGASAITVTVDSVKPCDQGFDHNLAVSVPAAGDRMVGPLPGARFAAEADGLVGVTYSSVTSVTVAAVRLRL